MTRQTVQKTYSIVLIFTYLMLKLNIPIIQIIQHYFMYLLLNVKDRRIFKIEKKKSIIKKWLKKISKGTKKKKEIEEVRTAVSLSAGLEFYFS